MCGNATTNEMRSFSGRRVLTGRWCRNEVALAIGKGYRMIEVYEVWHFSKTSDMLFKGYVRDFMKLKMESSAPPRYEDLDEFKHRVKNHLGTGLGDIKYNPGMRQISKLCLNSLWGKYGQPTNMPQTEYVTEPREFYKILLDDTHEDMNV